MVFGGSVICREVLSSDVAAKPRGVVAKRGPSSRNSRSLEIAAVTALLSLGCWTQPPVTCVVLPKPAVDATCGSPPQIKSLFDKETRDALIQAALKSESILNALKNSIHFCPDCVKDFTNYTLDMRDLRGRVIRDWTRECYRQEKYALHQRCQPPAKLFHFGIAGDAELPVVIIPADILPAHEAAAQDELTAEAAPASFSLDPGRPVSLPWQPRLAPVTVRDLRMMSQEERIATLFPLPAERQEFLRVVAGIAREHRPLLRSIWDLVTWTRPQVNVDLKIHSDIDDDTAIVIRPYPNIKRPADSALPLMSRTRRLRRHLIQSHEEMKQLLKIAQDSLDEYAASEYYTRIRDEVRARELAAGRPRLPPARAPSEACSGGSSRSTQHEQPQPKEDGTHSPRQQGEELSSHSQPQEECLTILRQDFNAAAPGGLSHTATTSPESDPADLPAPDAAAPQPRAHGAAKRCPFRANRRRA